MDKVMKKLGEAELEIMQVIWNTDAPYKSTAYMDNKYFSKSFLYLA